MEPLISVITPTWLRHQPLLQHCVPSVQEQTYTNVEHIIVSDGPDAELWGKLHALPGDVELYFDAPPEGVMRIPVICGYLPEHDPKTHWGNYARRRGLELASGDLIAYLDDDDTFRPRHLELLAACFQDPEVQWAYSKMRSGDTRMGVDPPLYGNIGTPMLMHRPELLKVASWGGDSACEDWELVRAWVAARAKYVFVPEITVDVRPEDWRNPGD